MQSKNALNGMKTFVAWLKQFSNIVLVAHNAKVDSSVIICAMHHVGITAIDSIRWYIDTLPLSREGVPNNRSYKQEDLMKDLCTGHYNAHDALADSQALQGLVLRLKISKEMMIKHSFSVDFVRTCFQFSFVITQYYMLKSNQISVDFVNENDNYVILFSKNAFSLNIL